MRARQDDHGGDLDELERAGPAERCPSARDRRARIIAVTAAGERAVAAAFAIVDGIYADVLAALPASERAGLVGALERLTGDGGRLTGDRVPGGGPGPSPSG